MTETGAQLLKHELLSFSVMDDQAPGVKLGILPTEPLSQITHQQKENGMEYREAKWTF